MPTKTKIEWCDYISNPLKAIFTAEPNELSSGCKVVKIGHVCEKISEGCANCWASTFNVRLGTGLEYTVPNMSKVEPVMDEQELERLRTFKPKGPFKNGRSRALVFPCDMTDLFGDWVSTDQLKRIFAVFAERKDLDFMVLTKRPAAMLAFLAGSVPLQNVILGVSIENQVRAWDRIGSMSELSFRGWKTGVSYEPALAPVNWGKWNFLDWVICGGESGTASRLMAPVWARSARDFCLISGIPFFFKQWGEWAPVKDISLIVVEQTRFRSKPVRFGDDVMVKVGKGLAGHLLDGIEWRQVPGETFGIVMP